MISEGKPTYSSSTRFSRNGSCFGTTVRRVEKWTPSDDHRHQSSGSCFWRGSVAFLSRDSAACTPPLDGPWLIRDAHHVLLPRFLVVGAVGEGEKDSTVVCVCVCCPLDRISMLKRLPDNGWRICLRRGGDCLRPTSKCIFSGGKHPARWSTFIHLVVPQLPLSEALHGRAAGQSRGKTRRCGGEAAWRAPATTPPHNPHQPN